MSRWRFTTYIPKKCREGWWSVWSYFRNLTTYFLCLNLTKRGQTLQDKMRGVWAFAGQPELNGRLSVLAANAILNELGIRRVGYTGVYLVGILMTTLSKCKGLWTVQENLGQIPVLKRMKYTQPKMRHYCNAPLVMLSHSHLLKGSLVISSREHCN